MKRLLPIAAAALLLAACGSAESTVDTSETTTTETSTVEVFPSHEDVEAPGVTLKLDSVTESDHLMLNAEGVEPGYLPEERQNPSDGGKFITVNTIVTNTSHGSMDLTCGFGVQAHLFNEDGQRYDPVQDLYRVPENPECNDSLNPGFSIEMSWPFEIPESMEATEFGFANPETNYDDLTLIDVTKAPREDTPGTEDSPPAQSPTEDPQAAVEEPSSNEVQLQNEGYYSSPDNPALAEYYAEQERLANIPYADGGTCPAYKCGYGTNSQGERNPSSGEIQTLHGCQDGYINDPELCGAVEWVESHEY
ncbi:hypothetical protein [Corynebacterium stationis]|uniref:hypothetical protein n=1 Tax=Corynebacterium stationis TaxID=1705 RepID=UPI0028AB843C|nr:hypothetical protein [Corynebacterium stationis]